MEASDHPRAVAAATSVASGLGLAVDDAVVLHGECSGLVLAMVAAWRWERHDRLPNGLRAGQDLLDALRAGPPWPALVTLMPPA